MKDCHYMGTQGALSWWGHSKMAITLFTMNSINTIMCDFQIPVPVVGAKRRYVARSTRQPHTNPVSLSFEEISIA